MASLTDRRFNINPPPRNFAIRSDEYGADVSVDSDCFPVYAHLNTPFLVASIEELYNHVTGSTTNPLTSHFRKLYSTKTSPSTFLLLPSVLMTSCGKSTLAPMLS